MTEVHFVFSDEAGDYSRLPSPTFIKNHPYFLRAVIGLSAGDWIGLRERYERERKASSGERHIHRELFQHQGLNRV